MLNFVWLTGKYHAPESQIGNKNETLAGFIPGHKKIPEAFGRDEIQPYPAKRAGEDMVGFL
jgi:hypothetical protein